MINLTCLKLNLFNLNLTDNPPTNFIFSKTYNSEFLYTEVWFTHQNKKSLEIEDKKNIYLVIKSYRYIFYKKVTLQA